MKVAFIGLGIMGSRMAEHLLELDLELTVYNRSDGPAEALGQKGAQVAGSAEAAVAEADIVWSMLSTPEVVENVFLGENGLVHHMREGALWADSTTVNPSFSRSVGERVHALGRRFIDAPVAGSKPVAASGELAFLVGGADGDVAEARPLMEKMGGKILHLGGHGQGAAFKMLVNSMLAQSWLIYSETVLLGQKMGLPEDVLLETLPGFAVAAPFTKVKAKAIRENDRETQFPLEWMHKDVHLAALTAYELNQPLTLANAAKEVYAQAKAAGFAREDFSAVHHYLNGINSEENE